MHAVEHTDEISADVRLPEFISASGSESHVFQGVQTPGFLPDKLCSTLLFTGEILLRRPILNTNGHTWHEFTDTHLQSHRRWERRHHTEMLLVQKHTWTFGVCGSCFVQSEVEFQVQSGSERLWFQRYCSDVSRHFVLSPGQNVGT